MSTAFALIAVCATAFAMIIDVIEVIQAWKEASRIKLKITRIEKMLLLPYTYRSLEWIVKAVWCFRYFVLGTSVLIFYTWLFGVTGIAGMVAGAVVSAGISAYIMFCQIIRRRKEKCQN
jgi:hypothetical protein